MRIDPKDMVHMDYQEKPKNIQENMVYMKLMLHYSSMFQENKECNGLQMLIRLDGMLHT